MGPCWNWGRVALKDKLSHSHPGPHPFFLPVPVQVLHGDDHREGKELTTHGLRWDIVPLPSPISPCLPLVELLSLWATPIHTPQPGQLTGTLAIPLSPSSSSFRKVLVTFTAILQMKKMETQRSDLIYPRSCHCPGSGRNWSSVPPETKG